MSAEHRCWCGNTALEPFGAGYLRCPACETLVAEQMPGAEIAQVADDDHDFYGRSYWFDHQERDLASINITVRARTDMPERCTYWLRALLNYCLPPARALEVGCGHGGFVALLNWMGYDASGLELSPWVVDFARRTFGAPVQLGTVESRDFAPGSFDLLALFDVLEHLPAPLGTMQRCADLLAAGGMLFLQTPCYPAGQSYDQLQQRDDLFLKMLLPGEHLYLFSQPALQRLCEQIGLGYVEFLPPMAGHDMLAIVGRQPLERAGPAAIEQALARPGSPILARALIDKDDQMAALLPHLAKKETELAALRARVEAQAAQAQRQAQAASEAKTAAEAYAQSLRDTLAARQREVANATTYIASLRTALAKRDAELARIRETRVGVRMRKLIRSARRLKGKRK